MSPSSCRLFPARCGSRQSVVSGSIVPTHNAASGFRREADYLCRAFIQRLHKTLGCASQQRVSEFAVKSRRRSAHKMRIREKTGSLARLPVLSRLSGQSRQLKRSGRLSGDAISGYSLPQSRSGRSVCLNLRARSASGLRCICALLERAKGLKRGQRSRQWA